MKPRGLAVIVAFLLAIAATSAVYLYVQGVRKDANGTNTNMVTVIVSKQVIPAQTDLDNLVSEGAFTTLRIPADAIVEGAVTQVSQLAGHTTAFPILQGEQITTARLQGSATQVEGGILGIPPGFKAITLPISLPQAVGGIIQTGDHVTLYATFDNVTVSNTDVKALLAGKEPTVTKTNLGDFTVTLVPDVEVLRAANPAQGNTQTENVLLTLALKPDDAQRVVFSQEQGKLWVGLLPPHETGSSVPPLNIIQVLK